MDLETPTPAERSEYAHGSSRCVRSVSVEFILSNQQLTVVIADIGESDRASTICLLREVAGFDERLHIILQLDYLSFSLSETRQSVSTSSAARGRCCDKQPALGVGAASFLDLSSDLSKVEQSPTQGASAYWLKCSGCEEIFGVQTVEPECPGQRNWVVLGDRCAYPLIGGSKASFGSNDIRAPTKHIGWLLVVRDRRNRWDLARCIELTRITPWLRSHQDVYAIQLLLQSKAERREGRSRLLEKCPSA